ncbi:unnamed protein product [Ascophyllum nodosum]
MNKRARSEQSSGTASTSRVDPSVDVVAGPSSSSSRRRGSISRSNAAAARARARERRSSCPAAARQPGIPTEDLAGATAYHPAGTSEQVPQSWAAAAVAAAAAAMAATTTTSRRHSTLTLPHGGAPSSLSSSSAGGEAWAPPPGRSAATTGAPASSVIEKDCWLGATSSSAGGGGGLRCFEENTHDRKDCSHGDDGGSAGGVDARDFPYRSNITVATPSTPPPPPVLLLQLSDLPDSALANAFFSGFLDSLHVACNLRLVSRRLMAIGRDTREVMDLHGLTISDTDLANIALAFPKLHHIDLRFCKGLAEGLGKSLRPCVNTLRTLSLRGVGASDAMLKGLGEFHELTSLDLSQSTSRDTSKMTATGLEELAGLGSLERLMLAWNKRGVTDDVVRLLCSNMCGLSELDLGLCGEITCSSLRMLSTQPKLRVLSIQACRNIDDEAIEVLVSACPGLTNLDLAHLPLLTRDSLHSLLHLKDLRKLDLRCCELISALDVADFRAVRPRTVVEELQAWWP